MKRFSGLKRLKSFKNDVEKVLCDYYLYLILISIMDEGSTIKVININSKRLKS